MAKRQNKHINKRHLVVRTRRSMTSESWDQQLAFYLHIKDKTHTEKSRSTRNEGSMRPQPPGDEPRFLLLWMRRVCAQLAGSVSLPDVPGQRVLVSFQKSPSGICCIPRMRLFLMPRDHLCWPIPADDHVAKVPAMPAAQGSFPLQRSSTVEGEQMNGPHQRLLKRWRDGFET